MKNIFLKNWKSFLIATSVFVSCVLLTLAMAPVLATTTPIQKKDYKNLSFKKAQALYHLRINNLFNNKIKLLIDEKGSDKGKCSDEKDITTYCLAETATEEYFRYREALLEKKNLPEDPSIRSGESLIKRYIKGDAKLLLNRLEKDPKLASRNLGLIAESHNEKIALINRELVAAKKALDKSLAAYNELRAAYPMHLQFQKIISNLIKYRDQLKKVRKEIEKYPGKFHDASTTKCQ